MFVLATDPVIARPLWTCCSHADIFFLLGQQMHFRPNSTQLVIIHKDARRENGNGACIFAGLTGRLGSKNAKSSQGISEDDSLCAKVLPETLFHLEHLTGARLQHPGRSQM